MVWFTLLRDRYTGLPLGVSVCVCASVCVHLPLPQLKEPGFSEPGNASCVPQPLAHTDRHTQTHMHTFTHIHTLSLPLCGLSYDVPLSSASSRQLPRQLVTSEAVLCVRHAGTEGFWVGSVSARGIGTPLVLHTIRQERIHKLLVENQIVTTVTA